MLTKNTIRDIVALKNKKDRDEQGVFVVEGVKMVEELLVSKGWEVVALYALKEWVDTAGDLLTEDAMVTLISEEELKKISFLTTPNQVLALVKKKSYTASLEVGKSSLCLVLDGINDPGNLGTIIRTADWYGIEIIICSPNCVDRYNPKVIQATMGSFLRVAIAYVDLPTYLGHIPASVPVYGALMQGENVLSQPLSSTGLVVMGSESHGISAQVLPYITHKMTIPCFSNNELQPESLNVGIATAIICHEFLRRTV